MTSLLLNINILYIWNNYMSICALGHDPYAHLVVEKFLSSSLSFLLEDVWPSLNLSWPSFTYFDFFFNSDYIYLFLLLAPRLMRVEVVTLVGSTWALSPLLSRPLSYLFFFLFSKIPQDCPYFILSMSVGPGRSIERLFAVWGDRLSLSNFFVPSACSSRPCRYSPPNISFLSTSPTWKLCYLLLNWCLK